MSLESLRLIDVLALGDAAALAVIAHGSSARAALPLVREAAPGERAWRVATAGDGITARLVECLGQAGSATPAPGSGFRVTRYGSLSAGHGRERDLGTDQSNTSVVVDG